tara:strand:+ start:234 stop:440 length:207 start_codon:yes stop_codon:yes gene_type:complete
MTVRELIEELRLMDQDAKVRFASQPSWPFEYSIYGVIQTTVKDQDMVYLEEGRQVGYLPSEVKEELGW